jgi:hypothetical protein
MNIRNLGAVFSVCLLTFLFTSQVLYAQNLGIGETNPAAKLHISNNPAGTTPLLIINNEIAADNDFVEISMKHAGNSQAFIKSQLLSNVSYNTNLIFGTASSQDGATANMWLQYNGNLGIGTSAPSQMLHVEGNARINGDIYDVNNSAGTNGQVLSKTASGIAWTSAGSLSGSGSATRLAFWSGGSTLSSNADLFWDNTNDRLGVGTSTPSALLHVDGDARINGDIYDVNNSAGSTGNILTKTASGIEWSANNAVTGSGTATQVAFFNTSSTLTSSTYLFYDPVNARLGVGTSIPSQLLHANGNIRIEGDIYDANNSAGSNGNILTKTASGIEWAANNAVTGSGTATQIAFWSGNTTLSSNANLFWNSTDTKLGIGTSAPGRNVHLKKDQNDITYYCSENQDNSSKSAAGYLSVTDGGVLGIGTASTAATSVDYPVGLAGNAYIIALEDFLATPPKNNPDLILGANNAEVMRINTSGNVGIGTTSPTSKLEISKSVNDSYIALSVFNTYTSASSTNEASVINFGFGTNTAARITAYKWDDFTSAAKSDGALGFATAENNVLTQHLTIQPDGNVGIGIVIPSAKLEVNGDMEITDGELRHMGTSNYHTIWIDPSDFMGVWDYGGTPPPRYAYWNSTIDKLVVSSSEVHPSTGMFNFKIRGAYHNRGADLRIRKITLYYYKNNSTSYIDAVTIYYENIGSNGFTSVWTSGTNNGSGSTGYRSYEAYNSTGINLSTDAPYIINVTINNGANARDILFYAIKLECEYI